MSLITGFFVFFNIFGFCASEDSIIKAMSDELKVSYDKLKNAEPYPLYFIQYQTWVSDNYSVGSKLGAITDETDTHQAILTCDMRMGSPELDSTHEIKGSKNYYDNSSNLDISIIPLNDYDAVRANIWELTDKTYKKTLDRYIKIIANKKLTAEEEDKSGDFIPALKPEVFYSTASKENIDREYIKGLLKKVSEKSKKYDFIINSGVSFSALNNTRYIVNTEGSKITEGKRKYLIDYYMTARTDDGLDISRYNSYSFENIKDIPDEKKISADFEKSASELKNLLEAKNLEPYHGPAIIENRAAAVFWHEIFGHRIEGHRQKSEKEGQTFAKKIGEKIMPDFITIYDDPNLKYYRGKFLNGHYNYDDEAVKSEKAVLVENGVLKGFLMQRVPLKGFNKSNGHGRRSAGYITVSRQGNLIMESSKTVSYDELKKMLIDEIKKSKKEYGIIIKDIEGGYTYTTRDMPQSYTILIKYAVKIYPDGKEEPVRGLNMIGTPLNTFPKILATGDDYDVFNGSCGAESGWVDVSAVSPSLLFSEIETQKVQKSSKKPPVLKPPYYKK
ncbi:MAG TPA: TldD/PmbA family protein [Elusimicrobiales bacterium]|nr:TldD/PmbA family protein [Elusimicrobiales bacterium]HPO94758.1 TldD/PmbA family protein [Elusimicrobiales bacterium]